jgi:hypothetical protein
MANFGPGASSNAEGLEHLRQMQAQASEFAQNAAQMDFGSLGVGPPMNFGDASSNSANPISPLAPWDRGLPALQQFASNIPPDFLSYYSAPIGSSGQGAGSMLFLTESTSNLVPVLPVDKRRRASTSAVTGAVDNEQQQNQYMQDAQAEIRRQQEYQQQQLRMHIDQQVAALNQGTEFNDQHQQFQNRSPRSVPMQLGSPMQAETSSGSYHERAAPKAAKTSRRRRNSNVSTMRTSSSSTLSKQEVYYDEDDPGFKVPVDAKLVDGGVLMIAENGRRKRVFSNSDDEDKANKKRQRNSEPLRCAGLIS